jgi:hypothetical protein
MQGWKPATPAWELHQIETVPRRTAGLCIQDFQPLDFSLQSSLVNCPFIMLTLLSNSADEKSVL